MIARYPCAVRTRDENNKEKNKSNFSMSALSDREETRDKRTNGRGWFDIRRELVLREPYLGQLMVLETRRWIVARVWRLGRDVEFVRGGRKKRKLNLRTLTRRTKGRTRGRKERGTNSCLKVQSFSSWKKG